MNFGAKNAAQSGVLSTAMGHTIRTGRPEKADRTTADVQRLAPTDEGQESGPLSTPSEQTQAKGTEGQQKPKRLVRKRVRRQRVSTGGTRDTGSSNRSSRTSGDVATTTTRGTSGPGKHMERLTADANLVRASQSQETRNNWSQRPQTDQGVRKQMLNNLSRMAKLNYVDLHTGGSDFAYPRREGRMIVMALAGLQAGGAKQQTKKADSSTSDSTSSSSGMTHGEYALKESVLGKVTAIFDPPPKAPPGYTPVELVA